MKEFYYGDDEYAIAQAVAQATREFMAQHKGAVVHRLDAGELTVSALLEHLLAVSLLNPAQLIVVRGVLASAANLEALAANLSKVPETTGVILLDLPSDTKNVHNLTRTKVYQALSAVCTVKKFALTRATPAVLAETVRELCQTHQVKLDSAAQAELIRRLGGADDPRTALAEASQRLSYLGRPLTAADVQRYITPDLAANAFGVLAAVLRGDTVVAQADLRELAAAGEDAIRFMGLVAMQVHALALAANGAASSLTSYQQRDANNMLRRLGKTAAAQQAAVRRLVAQLLALDLKLRRSAVTEAWPAVELALLSWHQ